MKLTFSQRVAYRFGLSRAPLWYLNERNVQKVKLDKNDFSGSIAKDIARAEKENGTPKGNFFTNRSPLEYFGVVLGVIGGLLGFSNSDGLKTSGFSIGGVGVLTLILGAFVNLNGRAGEVNAVESGEAQVEKWENIFDELETKLREAERSFEEEEIEIDQELFDKSVEDKCPGDRLLEDDEVKRVAHELLQQYKGKENQIVGLRSRQEFDDFVQGNLSVKEQNVLLVRSELYMLANDIRMQVFNDRHNEFDRLFEQIMGSALGGTPFDSFFESFDRYVDMGSRAGHKVVRDDEVEKHFSVLGIDQNSITGKGDKDRVKKVYKKLAIKYHPDRNPGDDSAVEKFKEASNAYEAVIKWIDRRFP